MNIVAIIAARMGSSRFPGKSLKPILGKPMLERIVERIAFCKRINQIIVATTDLPEDDLLVSDMKRIGISCFRGSSDDVLGRITGAAHMSGSDLVVEVLGDNPLIHSDLIEDVIDFYQTHDFEYVATVTREYPHASPTASMFPIGIRIQAFPPAVLARCERVAKEQRHREHATSYMYESPESFKLGYVEAAGKWAFLNRRELNFAVNYEQNFNLISHIFRRCYSKDSNFSLQTVMKTFDDNPQLLKLMGSVATPTTDRSG